MAQLISRLMFNWSWCNRTSDYENKTERLCFRNTAVVVSRDNELLTTPAVYRHSRLAAEVGQCRLTEPQSTETALVSAADAAECRAVTMMMVMTSYSRATRAAEAAWTAAMRRPIDIHRSPRTDGHDDR